MRSAGVELKFRDETPQPDVRIRRQWAGLSVESVRMHSARSFEYDWQGSENYLALHDIALTDGELEIGGKVADRRIDLRDRLTFVPPQARVSGWSQLAGADQGFTALFFDPGLAEAEVERPLLGIALRPLVYFEHRQLRDTLRRLERLLTVEDDPLTAETLGLLAVLQLYPTLGLGPEPAKGQLGLAQQRRLQEFVEEQLGAPISLSQMAAVAGLSRYHFARSFARTYGRAPHQYVLIRRIELAATFLATSTLPISEIASRVGFSSPARLSIAFRRLTGRTPRSFRLSVR